LLKDGVDLVKVMASTEGPSPAIAALKAKGRPTTLPQLTAEEIRAAVDEAHRVGKKVAAHAYGEAVRRVIDAGVDSVEHGIFLESADAKEMAARGIFLVPTFSVHKESTYTSWERGELKAKNMVSLFDSLNVSFKKAVEAGVPVACGTDALGDLPLEMKLMIEAGLKPMDAIVAATRTGAQVLGLEDEVGTVESGKLADVVVVRGDPLTDIMVIRDIEMVIQGGKILRPASFPDLPPRSLDIARSELIGYKETSVGQPITLHC
jgi:imidazolonepropionase-like amidohydrolase